MSHKIKTKLCCVINNLKPSKNYRTFKQNQNLSFYLNNSQIWELLKLKPYIFSCLFFLTWSKNKITFKRISWPTISSPERDESFTFGTWEVHGRRQVGVLVWRRWWMCLITTMSDIGGGTGGEKLMKVWSWLLL